MIQEAVLRDLYFNKKLSMKEISEHLQCSQNKVSYWMKCHNVTRRTIAEGVYIKKNPNGDPFSFSKPEIEKNSFLFGLGIGLYWGEGTKANRYSVRLGNTDPDLISAFIRFLEVFFNVKKTDLKFGLQIFGSMNKKEVCNFWIKELGVEKTQFMKVVVTQKRGKGTYTRIIKHGVLTIYFNNKKMRDLLVGEIENFRKMRYN
jgi:hypothetical protein